MDIFLIDDMPPEDVAMIQALYSRSPKSVVEHLKHVREKGSHSFMDAYYIGYNHKSIGDCGTTTLFIEGVSTLAAKFIQSTPLYSGQEASTRYIDFTKLFETPYIDTLFPEGQRAWFSLYNEVREDLEKAIAKKHDVTTKEEKKAAKALACDIAGSLLPVGTKTNLSWHTNLRQAQDHLDYLDNCPYEEVRDLSRKIRAALCGRYKASFRTEPKDFTLVPKSDYVLSPKDVGGILSTGYVNEAEYEEIMHEMMSQGHVIFDQRGFSIGRTNYTLGIPKITNHLGVLTFAFILDYRSFRDLQRHRACHIPIPYLRRHHGFSPAYLEKMELYLGESYRARIAARVEEGIRDASDSYSLPMGVNLTCILTGTLRNTAYIAELRSSKHVHFTLRPIAQKMGKLLMGSCPNLKLNVDFEEYDFVVTRGKQDIEKKSDQMESKE